MANVVVVGAQWGDEGKGKIVDWLSERADVVVRTWRPERDRRVVIVVDTGLTLLLANDAFIAWCEEHGLATNVVGKDIFTVLPQASTQSLSIPFEKMPASATPAQYQYLWITP